MKQLIVAFALSIICHSWLNAQNPCAIIWDPPVLLSDTTRDATFPKLALSGDDTVHIVWENGSFAQRLPYVRSVDGGTTLLPRRELLPDSTIFTAHATWDQIVTQKESVYVFFQGGASEDRPVRMLISGDAGSTWDSVRDISPNISGEIRSASMSGDTLAIVYASPYKEILRSTDRGQTWTQTHDTLNYDARVALSPGVTHLVQIGVVGNTGEAQYRRSTNLGDTWTQTMFLSTVDGLGIADPSIASSPHAGDSLLIAAWRDPKYGCMGVFGCSIISRVGVVRPDSTIWQAESVLTEQPRGYIPQPSMTNAMGVVGWTEEITAGDILHVAVSYSRSLSSAWCSPIDLTPTAFRAAYPSVAISHKAVHVVWQQFDTPQSPTVRVYYRRGRFIDTDVKEELVTPPPFARLQQNYPNPFNPSTRIVYRVQSREFVELRIYDGLGKEVATLVNEKKDPGEYTVDWSGSGMPSGVYYYRLVTGTRVETRKALLIR